MESLRNYTFYLESYKLYCLTFYLNFSLLHIEREEKRKERGGRREGEREREHICVTGIV